MSNDSSRILILDLNIKHRRFNSIDFIYNSSDSISFWDRLTKLSPAHISFLVLLAWNHLFQNIQNNQIYDLSFEKCNIRHAFFRYSPVLYQFCICSNLPFCIRPKQCIIIWRLAGFQLFDQLWRLECQLF